MSKLKFSDGEEFDLSGPLKIELRNDGWYVSGENMLIPVDSYHDAEQVIKQKTINSQN
jgi:hypothetical protein